MSILSLRQNEKRKRLLVFLSVFAVVALVTLGIFASNGWLPHTDALTGKKTGWFGRELPKHATSAWNPFPPPSPTPQLSKEIIWAGSRMVAIEDANATAAPPADIAVWRPSNGNWIVMGQTGSQATTFSFGMSGDIPVPGDFDGDGKTDFSVFRPSDHIWYIQPSGGGNYYGLNWGISTDLPAEADYDGDGRTDAAIMRRQPSTGTSDWWVLKSSDNSYYSWSWGTDTDIPGSADFDGDGRADIAVYRPGNQYYYSINSSNGQAQMIFLGQTVSCSIPRECVVPADYDGDGKADFAVYNSPTASWTIRFSVTGQVTTTQWGSSGDVPVHNDYDGDGKCDLATWRSLNALWTIKKSSNGQTRTETFGQAEDIPVPAYYRR